jgi:hypothetical protein
VHTIVKKTKHRTDSQSGAALVIAIFSLMLISVVATALIVTAGTQTAIKANYKSAMHAFYDARAGLEEARGRLWAGSLDTTGNPDAITGCVFPGGNSMQVGKVCYIVNPDSVDPTNPTGPYADLEYQQEWGTSIPAGTQLIASKSATASLSGPLYKWVRVTARTEASAGFDSDADGSVDNTPLFFDGQHVFDSKGVTEPPGTPQVLTITALAVTPSNSRRLVQYTVAPSSFNSALTSFPSALTLDGNGVKFKGPASSGDDDDIKFQINGNDMSAPTGTPTGVRAIGYTNSNDATAVTGAATPATIYQSPQSPSVAQVNLPSLLQTPSGLQNLVQSIAQTADLVLNPAAGTAASQTNLPSNMSASHPVVVVVNGDFNLHGYGTGYGLLVVTGTLDYDPDASWNGVILVIGKGVFTSTKAGNGTIDGAVFVAQTLDSTGKVLPDPNLGAASFTQTGGGSGIFYNTNWINTVQALMPYQVLSFREIAQTAP